MRRGGHFHIGYWEVSARIQRGNCIMSFSVVRNFFVRSLKTVVHSALLFSFWMSYDLASPVHSG
jgi:hypothetical protein